MIIKCIDYLYDELMYLLYTVGFRGKHKFLVA